MNRIYSLVWNRALHSVQVASELATSGGGGNAAGTGTPHARRHPLTLACAAALALGAFALPAWPATCTVNGVAQTGHACAAQAVGVSQIAAMALAGQPDVVGVDASSGGNGGVGGGAAGGNGGSGNGGGGAGGAEGASGHPGNSASGGNGGNGGYGTGPTIAGGTGGAVGATSIGGSSIAGGNGGAGMADQDSVEASGGGGGGGAGVYTSGTTLNLAAGLSVTGGNGGNAGVLNLIGGGGGGGGAGLMSEGAGANIANYGNITGGNGGNGAGTQWGGGGGGGGDGLFVAGSGSHLTNKGSITGGAGGATNGGFASTAGAGGAGVDFGASGGVVGNYSSITGGAAPMQAGAGVVTTSGIIFTNYAGSITGGAASAAFGVGGDGINALESGSDGVFIGNSPGAIIQGGAGGTDSAAIGVGGAGIDVEGFEVSIDNYGTIEGGQGGGVDGGSGTGGTGITVSADNGTQATVTNESGATIQGGYGGVAGSGDNGGLGVSADGEVTITNDAGASIFGDSAGVNDVSFNGGIGINASSGVVIDNSGTIAGTGGTYAAGSAINAYGTQINNFAGGLIQAGNGSGTGDADGGDAIIANGNTAIVNAGSIIGGSAAGTGAAGDAVYFSGGFNSLELEVGSTETGNIVSTSGTTNGDSFMLGDNPSGGGSNSLDIGTVSGFVSYSKTGTSTWTLTGTGSSDQNWSVVDGVLAGDATAIVGDITFNPATGDTAAVTFDQGSGNANSPASATYAGAITGDGSLTKTDDGTLILTGTNTYSGTTTIDAGTVQVGDNAGSGSIGTGDTNIATGSVLDFDRTGALSYGGAIFGGGTLQQTAAGTLTLNGSSGAFAGSTEVTVGTLLVGDASHSGAALGGSVTVDSGAVLGGFGGVGAANELVEIKQGGILSPGAGVDSMGTLTVGGDLALDAGSVLNFDLGAPDASNPQVTPGLSDHVDVGGTLTFDGGSTLNLVDAGSMGPGLYNLANYGSLAMNNCAIGGSGTQCVAVGSVPQGSQPYNFTVVNNTQNQQVDLYNTAGLTLNIWDPSGNTSQLGGTGTWTVTSPTWTDPAGDGPAPMNPQPGFAIFQGTPGTVTIDDGATSATQVSATGLQFAVDGYTLAGDPLNLVGTTSGSAAAASIIEVGDGSSNSANMTATISASLQGTDGFAKTGAGTLALTSPLEVNGLDGLSGTVDIEAGTLQLGTTNAQGLQDVVVLRDPVTMAAGSQLVLRSGGVDPYSYVAPTAPVGAAVSGQGFSITASTTGTGTVSAIVGIVPIGATQGADAGSAIAGTGFTATFTGNTFVAGSLTSVASLLVGAAAITGSNFQVTNANASGSYQGIQFGITGGMGANSQSGTGGTGGAGVSGSGFTVTNSGGIYGGAGGPTQTGTVGAGGAGISGSGFTVTNTGKITGGAGGGVYAASGNYTPGTGTLTGLGGAGVSSLGGATVINEGTISGGASGAGQPAADAINFTGGGNTLELIAGHPGTFNGAIVVTRVAGDAADTLELGGDSGSDTFDLSKLASGGEFGGFNAEAKSGASTWTLTGTGATSENWTITGGTLIGDTTALQGNIAFAPASGATATVEFDQDSGNANSTADATYAGVISGAGDFVKSGDGTLTLTGANTFTGSATISAGTLQVGDGGTTGAIGTGAIIDNGTLVFDRRDAITLTGAISGSGSLTKQGANTLTVNGDGSAFTGTTTIPAGTLTVGDDSHASAALGGMVTIAKGATLTGIGTIGGMDLSGTLSPGGSIGTFHVAGDATFESGSTFNVEANPDGTSDQLAVTGTTTIKGGNTVVLSQPGNWSPSTTYTIITSGDGVSGTFSGVSDNQAFLTPTLGYKANDVTLTLARNDVAFPDVANTPNEKGAAAGIEGAGSGTALYDAVVKLNAADARVAFDQTSGEYHASQQTARIDDSRYVREAMNQRLRTGDADAETAKLGDTNLTAWAHAWGHWGTVDGDGNAAQLADNGDGLLIGADMPVGTQARIGVTGGASRNSLSINDRDSWGKETSTWLGAFAGYDAGALGLRGGIAYAWDRIPTHRAIAFPGYTDRLSGNATGDTLTGFIEGSWTFHFANGRVSPFLNLAHTKVETDTSTEAGGAAALHAFDSTTNVSFSTLGARGEINFAHHLNLHGELGWQHAFGDTTPEADLQFVAGGTAFTEYGVPIAKDAGLGQIGLGWHQGNVAVDADYEGLAGNGVKDQAAKVSVSITF